MPVVFNPFTGNLDFTDTTAAGGANTQVQFNDGGTLAGDTAFTWDKTNDQLTISGDVNLDTGGGFSTTIQSVTPTANRTISFPDQTGTVGLVAGATGNIQYNNAGQLAGTGDFNVDLNWTDAGVTYTGLKVNVTDTASAADSNLIDIQSNGTSQVVVDDDGNVGIGTTNVANRLTVVGPAINSAVAYLNGTDAANSSGLLVRAGGTNSGKYIARLQDAAANTRVEVLANGNVGIGTSSPGANLEISSASGGVPNVILKNTATGCWLRMIGATPNSSTSLIDANGPLSFRVGSSYSERLRIDSAGYLRLSSNSGGIQFNGDTAAANALNDYEEGTWTPVIEGTSTTGTGTYTIQSGRYTKIGDSVLLRARISWTAHTGTGSIFISGLPFSVSEFSGFSVRTGNGLTVGANKTYVDQTTNKLVIEATITGTGDIILGAQYRS